LAVPRFEFPDGIPQERQPDVRINRVHIPSTRVTHQFLPDVDEYLALDETGIEGMTQIVKAIRWEPGTAKRRLPRGLDPMDWLVLIGEDCAGRFANRDKQGE
jgi:hypothetical protein